MTSSWAVYCHVPFCLRRCGYCDFATAALPAAPAAQAERLARYREAIGRELAAEAPRPARTVYFGGGTPTTLGADALLQLLHRLGPLPEEVTCEANPTTAEAGLFAALRQGGFSRLSLGVQSLDDRLLRGLGRTHGAAEAYRACDLARAAGFDNLSLDLMFALPGQDLAGWRRTLREAVALEPAHISLYGLTIEPGTRLDGDVAAGLVQPVDEDTEADMYQAARDDLGAAGYEHYEIANFARPGRRCAHNQVYWHNEEYRGYGPAAASYVDRRRWSNRTALDDYAASLAAGDSPVAESETRLVREEQQETMWLGLRMLDGISSARFATRYGVSPDEVFGRELARLAAAGLLTEADGHWRLTPHGVQLANVVFREFVD